MKLRSALLTALFFATLLLAGCAGRPPETVEKVVTVEVTVPVVQTRVVIATRQVEVERTVVVTATPEPTPAYVSKINASADTLVYPLSGEPITLDPQAASDEISGLVVQQLYEGLFNLRGDGQIVPAAATGYQVSADGRVYTVTLRAGMTWSDGQPVTAQQYVDGVCRLLDPSVGNAYYYLLSDVAQIVGAGDYASGDVADCEAVGVKAVDERTLEFTLKEEASFFPKIMAFHTFLPARLDLVSAHPDTWTESENFVGNGPYLLTEHVSHDHLTLTRNPDYWNAAEVGVGRIEFEVVPDLAEQLRLYEQGDLQVAGFPAEATARIQADPAFNRELHVLVQPGTSYLGLNTQTGPTQDVNFRRAIASAIDRQTLITDVLKQPWHVPAQVIIPPDIPGYQGDDPSVGYPYDPEKARAYLAEAGYDDNNPPPPVDLWFNREGNNPLLFRAIGKMLEEVGIPVRLVSSSWDVYLASLDDCNKPNRADATKTPGECTYNLYRMGWVMDYADPSSILDVVFSPKSAFQYTGWQSEEYEKLLSEALAEQDKAARTELYRQAERILLNDAVIVVPLMHYDRTVLIKDGVTFDYPPLGAPNLQYWKVTP